MKITFETITLPFKVGDIVFVNQAHGERLSEKKGKIFPYFEAEIARIFLDGRLEELTVITEPLESYPLDIKTVVYELKPVREYADLVRMPLSISLPIKAPKLFKSEAELLEYRETLERIEKERNLKPGPKEDKPI